MTYEVMNESNSYSVLVILGVAFCAMMSGLIGYITGRFRGQAQPGFWYGCCLGPVGWIIAALLPEAGQKCPECFGVMPYGAHRCKHCGETFDRPLIPR